MREILFRGKRVEEPIKIKPYAPDGWVYGDLITCDDGHFILPHDISGEMYIDRPYKFRANDVEARVMLAKVGENTTGQYTGLKDKNGTKIFEGDIFEHKSFSRRSLYIVEFKNERGGWYPFASGDGCGCCEAATYDPSCYGIVDGIIVGNIHDNPELLEGKDVKD